ncbi:MAG: hypothetical protein PVI23_14205 [Maricaulaceae bacterium]
MRSLVSAAFAALATAALPAAPASAEVVSADEYGFALSISINTSASPGAAFVALSRFDEWWDPAHTYSGDAANLSIELEPGGCFCEEWGQGAVRHAEVVQVRGEQFIRWTGGLGPLQDLGLVQVHDWSVEQLGVGSRITYSTRVTGHPADGLADLAGIVDAVMTGQMERLEAYIIEEGGFAR